MTDAKDNGAATNPFGFTAEEAAQVQAMAQEQAVGGMMQLLLGLAPHVAPATMDGIIRAVLRQQAHADFGRVLDDATDPKMRKENPVWGVNLMRRGNAKAVLMLQTQKDPGKLKGPDELMQYATLVGLVTNPTVRALLLAHGYEPHFFQSKGSLIIGV